MAVKEALSRKFIARQDDKMLSALKLAQPPMYSNIYIFIISHMIVLTCGNIPETLRNAN